VGHEIKDVFDRESRAFDDRLADHDFGIAHDPLEELFICHGFFPSTVNDTPSRRRWASDEQSVTVHRETFSVISYSIHPATQTPRAKKDVISESFLGADVKLP
jgi:hypothetical protein